MTSSSSDTPDQCPSGGSASQSPDSVISLHNNNNNNKHSQENSNYESKSFSWNGESDNSSFDYEDHGFYDKVRQKVKQKNRRQAVQHHYDALINLVPVLKRRTSRSPLTKNAILKSTILYINQLKEDSLTSGSHHLKEKLRHEYDRNTRLQKEFDEWQEKLHNLRELREEKTAKKPHN
ncbi:uncharacterized protein [Amphiura filiformis]|uniref:uncharacterized protein n=1 Tax=Amphiura filiformis TaxID=82378 RepID=UPI003B2142B6